MAPPNGVCDPKLLALPKPWDEGANDWPKAGWPTAEKGPLLLLDPNDEDGDPKEDEFWKEA